MTVRVIIDITFCGMTLSLRILLCLMIQPVGDWAGSSYATSGCPGTCAERLMDPANFVVRFFLKKHTQYAFYS